MARYHEGQEKDKDRDVNARKESTGDKKANPGVGGGVYSDGFANLPEEKVMKEFPKARYSGPIGYNDTREGIDMLAADNHKHMMKKGSR